MATTAEFWCITDLETSGLNPDKGHEILEIARTVVDVVNRQIVPTSTMQTYVKPVRWEQREPEALEINGLKREQLLESGVCLHDALGEWARGVDWQRTILASWGNDFELKFLNAAFLEQRRVIPYNYKTVDVRSAAFIPLAAQGRTEYPSLAEACGAYSIPFDRTQAHSALYDTMRTAEVVVALLNRVELRSDTW